MEATPEKLRNDQTMSEDGHSAASFDIGDTVSATSDFRIGGALAIEKGCRGTVMCHGERPDGSVGISIHWHTSRKDGRDINVLCQPHEIQVVAKAANAQPMSEHLRCAWKSVRVWAKSFREILPSSPVQLIFENLAHALAPKETTTPMQKQQVKKMQKANELSQHMKKDFDDDDSDYATTNHLQRWSMIIGVLFFVNILLAYVHMQRSAANLQVVKVLTDDSLSAHIVAHPYGTLVNFFSSPCEHCAQFAPEFEEAAKQLQKTTNVSLVSVNARLAPLASKQYLVFRYPTLFWFRHGRLGRGVAPSVRSVAQILEFVNEAVQPAVIEFSSYAEFLEAVPQLRAVLSKGKTPPIIAGFGPDPAVHEVLEQAGEKFRGKTAFLFVPEARHDDPTIRAYFRYGEADQDYNGSLKVDDFLKWLQPFLVEQE